MYLKVTEAFERCFSVHTAVLLPQKIKMNVSDK